MKEEKEIKNKWVSENIWGWKWSWISLVIILAGFLFLIFAGPVEDVNMTDELNEKDRVVDSTSLNIND